MGRHLSMWRTMEVDSVAVTQIADKLMHSFDDDEPAFEPTPVEYNSCVPHLLEAYGKLERDKKAKAVANEYFQREKLAS
jgi:hypothetical protein